ncbi:hypothetical protein INS49_006311 [Diaporthe citri]|uniref:uncharacterized protein n=1 Tax=Diaporthe citri TaxID=83186 RepID=UPI001C7EC7CB|nr:uncharacterized protein INS49_006311 [Diaporthe citri]KAG6364707.1 hypothetical protein INS49_006311 [Diaporthe citri]
MPEREEIISPRETTGEHSYQTRIHSPQPVNLAALRRLEAILDICDTSIGNSPIAAGGFLPQVDTASLHREFAIIAAANSAATSDGGVKSHDLLESPPTPYPSTVSQDNTNLELEEDSAQTPEHITFWPALERHLNHPTLPRPRPICTVCFDVMPVLGLDQAVREDPSYDYERCVVLLCGHLIGERCLDEHVSKHVENESNRYWQEPPEFCEDCSEYLEE